MRWDVRFLDKIVHLGWVVIWVRRGDDRGAFTCLGDGWHEKKQNKNPKYYLLGHKRAMTGRYMGNNDMNLQYHTQIYQECRGCMVGRFG